MNIDSTKKVIDAGFTVIRKEDHPLVRIKMTDGYGNWRTLIKFDTKAERDRTFKKLLEDKMTIDD